MIKKSISRGSWALLGPFWVILEPFGVHFGRILKPFWASFGMNLEPFCRQLRVSSCPQASFFPGSTTADYSRFTAYPTSPAPLFSLQFMCLTMLIIRSHSNCAFRSPARSGSIASGPLKIVQIAFGASWAPLGAKNFWFWALKVALCLMVFVFLLIF